MSKKFNYKVGDCFRNKSDLEQDLDIIYEITETRRSNTQFKLEIKSLDTVQYWSFASNPWTYGKYVEKLYVPLNEVEKLLYV